MLPTAQRYGLGVLTYGPLSSGRLSGRADPSQGRRSRSAPGMFDLTVPANQARQQAVQRLTELAAEAGMPLTHLAIAFARSHPAVTSVLVGPREPGQLADLLAGADIELTGDVLDRIDEIVPPGTEINPADNYLAAAPALGDKRLRRLRAASWNGWPGRQREAIGDVLGAFWNAVLANAFWVNCDEEQTVLGWLLSRQLTGAVDDAFFRTGPAALSPAGQDALSAAGSALARAH